MMEDAVRQILQAIGEDPEREGLLDTPKRVRKSFEYLMGGYRKNLAAVINGALFEAESDDMIIVRDIEFYSMCEHHSATSVTSRRKKSSASAKWRGLSICFPGGCRFRSV